MYVDLNAKQAFPIDELPAPATDAIPAHPAAGEAPAAGAAAARLGQAAQRGVATMLCELPLRAGEAASRRLSALRQRGATNSAAPAAEAAASPDAAAASTGPVVAAPQDSVTVPMAEAEASATKDGATERELQARQQWYDSVPVEALPKLAVMPDAQLSLCRLDSLAGADTRSDGGGAGTGGEAAAATATRTSNGPAPASGVSAVSGSAEEGMTARGAGDARAASEAGDGLGAAQASGVRGGGEGREGSVAVAGGGVSVEAGEEEDEGDDPLVPGMLYFFKADVVDSDFSHVLPVETAGARSRHEGLLQGLSGWLAGSGALMAPRKGSWALDGGAGGWDTAAAGEDGSIKSGRWGKHSSWAWAGGDGDGADARDGEQGRRGKGSSRVLEGVWLALAGRGGSRQLDGSEGDGEELRAMPSQTRSIGAAAPPAAPMAVGLPVSAV